MTKNLKSATETPNPAGQLAGADEIDLGAALPTKPRRGRPRTATPKPQKDPNRKVRKDKGIKKGPLKPQTPYIDNNILMDNKVIKGNVIDYSDKGEVQSATRLKDKITDKELRFIGFYLSGEHTIKESMILAGYEGYHEKYLYQLAGKIIEKYESQAEDHRIIARALGAGEVFVIKGLMDLAKNSTSGMVQRAALADLAKILGLTKEQLEGAGGITLIFEGQGQPQVALVGPGAPPFPATPAALPGPTSDKPMMITK